MAKIEIPELSNLQIPDRINRTETITETNDTQRIRQEYTVGLSVRKREIIDKISSIERKLKKHELKEGMLDRIITETYTEMDNLKSSEFTRRGQKQSILIKQMEALSILQDTLVKFEDMIYKYQRILIDIENHKLNSFIKMENLKKEERINDDSITEVLMAIQEQLNGSSGAHIGVSPMIEEIQQELRDANY